MKRKIIRDYIGVGSLKEFRDNFGFTQDEFSALLEVNRAQLSMAESLSRSLPEKAIAKCKELQLLLQLPEDVASDTNWDKYDEDRRIFFYWQCEQSLINCQYQLAMLKKELPEMKRLEQQLQAVINNWSGISGAAQNALPTDYKTTITSRTFSKLARYDIAARLEKELQIKILLARIDVLTQLIADNHRV